jgi:hypothetical protein
VTPPSRAWRPCSKRKRPSSGEIDLAWRRRVGVASTRARRVQEAQASFLKTIFPKTSPAASASRPRRPSWRGTTSSISGRTPERTQKRRSCFRSSSVPIVEPTIASWRKYTCASPAGAASPVVAPETTIVPPDFTERIECAHVAAPTVSITASTRSGSRAPGSKAASAPNSSARARFSSDRLVTHTRSPAAAPSRSAAVATPPPAPCTSTVAPGATPEFVNSIRYAVSHAVGRHAASANESAGGFGTRLRAGTATRSAKVPGYRSERIVRVGSSVSSPRQSVSPITECTTTSFPSSSIPAASQPRIIGSCSADKPTPRSDQRSWWLSDAARTDTVAQPSRRSGSGCSPSSSPESGSSASIRAA